MIGVGVMAFILFLSCARLPGCNRLASARELMASTITHLIIGEHTLARLQRFESAVCGSFLLGCILADVNNFSAIDRRTTHFVGRLHEDGEDAFTRSCTNFLNQLDTLLGHPWDKLVEQERAFVAGYLCHLAADEVWKRMSQSVMVALGITSLVDIPVPGEVFMTAFDVLSHEAYIDAQSVAASLDSVVVPDVLTHVPHQAFQTMWDVVKPHAMDGKTAESYFEMLRRLGKTAPQMEAVRREHTVYWQDAVALIGSLEDVGTYIADATKRSLEVLPRLWARSV
jgi:hypothetical protein